MKFNAHIKQSNDNVAEFGKGLSSLVDYSDNSTNYQTKYWTNSDITLIKDDRDVSNSSINNDTQAFKESFVQRVYSNKKSGSQYYYDRFFNNSGQIMSQSHELPTAGQMVDYILNKEYGLIEKHIGNHLGIQTSSGEDPSGTNTFNFKWIWDTPYNGTSSPTGWDNANLITKMNWILKNLLDYGQDTMSNSFKLFVHELRGTSITVSNQSVGNNHIVNLTAGNDQTPGETNPLVKILGGTGFIKSFTLYPRYVSPSENYDAVIKAQTGTHSWVTNGNYAGIDVNRYYLRDSSNKTTFNSGTKSMYLDSTTDGKFRINIYDVGASSIANGIEIPFRADQITDPCTFIIDHCYSDQTIDCKNKNFTLGFNNASNNTGFILANVQDLYALQDYASIKHYPKYSTSLSAPELWSTYDSYTGHPSRRLHTPFWQQDFTDDSVNSIYRRWIGEGNPSNEEFCKVLLSRGSQKICGILPSTSLSTTNFNQRKIALRLDLCDQNGAEAEYFYPNGIYPIKLGVHINHKTTSPAVSYSKFYLIQSNELSKNYLKTPILKSTTGTYASGAEFIVNKPKDPQTIDNDLNIGGSLDVSTGMTVNNVPIYNTSNGIFLPKGYIDGLYVNSGEVTPGLCLDTTGNKIIKNTVTLDDAMFVRDYSAIGEPTYSKKGFYAMYIILEDDGNITNEAYHCGAEKADIESFIENDYSNPCYRRVGFCYKAGAPGELCNTINSCDEYRIDYTGKFIGENINTLPFKANMIKWRNYLYEKQNSIDDKNIGLYDSSEEASLCNLNITGDETQIDKSWFKYLTFGYNITLKMDSSGSEGVHIYGGRGYSRLYGYNSLYTQANDIWNVPIMQTINTSTSSTYDLTGFLFISDEDITAADIILLGWRDKREDIFLD